VRVAPFLSLSVIPLEKASDETLPLSLNSNLFRSAGLWGSCGAEVLAADSEGLVLAPLVAKCLAVTLPFSSSPPPKLACRFVIKQ
jgi:hypothetical protein